jgi:MFS family permease
MAFVALPLLAVTMTKDPLLIAGVAVAGQLPWLVFALPAGALADRVNRRRLAVQVEVFRAAVLAAFVVTILTGHRSIIGLYVTALLIGACETAFFAATSSSLPSLVPRESLPRSNGYLLAADTAGEQFGGPAIGGVLYGWSASVPFIGDAVSFLASALLLNGAIPASTPDREARPGLLADMRSGLRWFAGNRLMRLLAGVIAMFAFCQAVILGVLVLYAVRVLHLDKAGYGLFLALGAVGNVAGGLLAGRIHARLGPRWTIVGAGVLAALGYGLLSRTSVVAVAVIAVAIQALAVSVGNVATMSLRQLVIPPELLGRVNNVFRTVIWGMMPVGALTGGLLASQLSLPTTFLIAGGLQLAVILAAVRPLGTDIASEPALQLSAELSPNHGTSTEPGPTG